MQISVYSSHFQENEVAMLLSIPLIKYNRPEPQDPNDDTMMSSLGPLFCIIYAILGAEEVSNLETPMGRNKTKQKTQVKTHSH